MQLVPSDRKSWEAPPGTSYELINSARTSTASLISGQGVAESLWLSSPGYFIEEPTAKTPPTEEELVLKEHINIFDYCRYFLNQTVHANIIGNECNLGAVCISIQKESEERKDSSFPTGSKERFYRVLIRAKQGDRRMEIPASWVKLRKKESYARSEDLLAALKKMLKPTFSPKGLYVIRDPESHNEFAALEGKLRSNCSKLGVVYGKNGQDETQMYNNVTGSPAFEEFLECMGTKINMMGWQGYRGDLSAKLDQDTYYTKLDESNYEIMFHVSTYLQYMAKTDEECQQWERKRFIGNDIVVILFYEGEEPLDPALFISNFNHVFALVQPIHKNGKTFYRLSMAYKNGVAESQPRLPEVPIFEKGPYFRKFLLTKMINAERCALSAPQFRRAQERVRSELFLNLQDKFPKKKSGSRRVKDPIEVNTGYVTSATLDKIRQQGGLSS
ncbi:Signal-induced proliferation-associated protein 1 [Balamuthia mandrillaris]